MKSTAALGALPVSRTMAGPGPLAGKIRIAVKYQMIAEPKLGVVEKFRLLKDIGFDGTELKTDDPVDTEEIVKAIEETGLPVHGVMVTAIIMAYLKEAIGWLDLMDLNCYQRTHGI